MFQLLNFIPTNDNLNCFAPRLFSDFHMFSTMANFDLDKLNSINTKRLYDNILKCLLFYKNNGIDEQLIINHYIYFNSLEEFINILIKKAYYTPRESEEFFNSLFNEYLLKK